MSTAGLISADFTLNGGLAISNRGKELVIPRDSLHDFFEVVRPFLSAAPHVVDQENSTYILEQTSAGSLRLYRICGHLSVRLELHVDRWDVSDFLDVMRALLPASPSSLNQNGSHGHAT